MDRDIRFSIIFPAYNVGTFITEAIEDILHQTYTNFELIIVDDASTDNTGEIADAFAGKRNVTVIHKATNEGVSAARNTGIQKAKGEYVLFLDPDDLYEKNLLETVRNSLCENPVDVLVYSLAEDYYSTEGKILYAKIHTVPEKTYTGEKDIARLAIALEKETMYGYVWNKAYRLSMLREKKIIYPDITHIEDILFNIAVFDVARTVKTIPDILYHYRNQGQVRLTGKYLPDYFLLQKKRFSAIYEQQKRMDVLDETSLQILAAAYFRAFLSMIEREMEHKTPKQKIEEKIELEFSDQSFLRLAPHLKAEGRLLKFLFLPLSQKKIKTAMRRTKMVYCLKRMTPMLYARMKQHR